MAGKGFDLKGWAILGGLTNLVLGALIWVVVTFLAGIINPALGSTLVAAGLIVIPALALVGAVTWVALGFVWTSFLRQYFECLSPFLRIFVLLFVFSAAVSLLGGMFATGAGSALVGAFITAWLVTFLYSALKWQLPAEISG